MSFFLPKNAFERAAMSRRAKKSVVPSKAEMQAIIKPHKKTGVFVMLQDGRATAMAAPEPGTLRVAPSGTLCALHPAWTDTAKAADVIIEQLLCKLAGGDNG